MKRRVFAFLFATWQPIRRFSFTPSMDLADDRWSDVNPVTTAPYIKTGGYALMNLDATYTTPGNFQVSLGLKNAFDDYYKLSWGLPQPGRTFYVKAKTTF